MIWKIINISRLQKIQKLRDSLSREFAVERTQCKLLLLSQKIFFEEIKHVTHKSPQTSQKQPKIEMRSFSKDLQSSIWYDGVNLLDVYRKATRFLQILYQQKHCQVCLKGIEYKLQSILVPQQADNNTVLSYKHVLHFMVVVREEGVVVRTTQAIGAMSHRELFRL